MEMGHGVENRQGMWKEGEGAFPPAQTDVWSAPVLARGLLHVQPIPWQEQPSSCRQFIVSLFPLTPKVPSKLPCNQTTVRLSCQRLVSDPRDCRSRDRIKEAPCSCPARADPTITPHHLTPAVTK